MKDRFLKCFEMINTFFSDKLSSEHATEMEDIKSLVHRLFVALHLEDHQIKKERELLQKLDHLKEQLMPLEQVGRKGGGFVVLFLSAKAFPHIRSKSCDRK